MSEKTPETTSDKLVKVRLDGVGLTESGVVKSTQMLEAFREDLDIYKEITLSADEAKGLARQMRRLRTGFLAAIPIICPGCNLCPLKTVCPLAKIDLARVAQGQTITEPACPVGSSCPIENNLMVSWLDDYCKKLDVKSDDELEIILVKELIELDVMELRLSTYLSDAERAMGVGKNVIGLDQATGEPIMVEQIAPAMELKLKVKDRRLKILEELVATRKEQYKKKAALKEANTDDPSSLAAALKRKLEEALAAKLAKNLVDTTLVDGVYIPKA